MKTRSLGKSNLMLTEIGFGGGAIGGLYRAVSTQAAIQTMNSAWDRGIRYFDTAPFYGFGLSERRIGDFLREKPRNDYILSTKVGKLLRPVPNAAADNPLALPSLDGVIIPDQLFGIDYGGKYRFFALEADRKTESIVSAKAMSKSFGKKLESYLHVLEHQTYREVWGIPTLSVLTVTTSQAHMNSMTNQLDRLAKNDRIAARFLFKTTPQFGKYWTVPEVMHDLLTDPWERVDTPLDISEP